MKPLAASFLLTLAACACPQPSSVAPAQPVASPQPAPEPAQHGHDHAGHDHAEHDHAEHDHAAHDHAEHGAGDHHDHGAPKEGDRRAPLVHRFDETDPAIWAKRFESDERDAYQKPDAVVKALELRPGMHVADIGTGTGYFVPRLSKAVGHEGRVHAVDIAPNMVRHVKARANEEGLDNVAVSLALTDDPLLMDGALDRILIVNTWHHIAEREAYSEKLAAALKPGGQIFIVDFKRTSNRGPKKEHKLAPDQVAAELRAGGLEPTIDADLLDEQYIVRGTKP